MKPLLETSNFPVRYRSFSQHYDHEGIHHKQQQHTNNKHGFPTGNDDEKGGSVKKMKSADSSGSGTGSFQGMRKSSSMPSLISSMNDSSYFTDSSQNLSIGSDLAEHFDTNEALALVDRCFRCTNEQVDCFVPQNPSESSTESSESSQESVQHNINVPTLHPSASSPHLSSQQRSPNRSPVRVPPTIETFLEEYANSIRMKFVITVGSIQVSWKRAATAANDRDEYHLKAYLLLDHSEDKIKGKPYHRQWDQAFLTRLDSKELIAGFRNQTRDLLTQICFKNQEFGLETKLVIDKVEEHSPSPTIHPSASSPAFPTHLADHSQPYRSPRSSPTSAATYRFHNKILRLKLERSKPGSNHHNNVSIGFVDIDLSQSKNLMSPTGSQSSLTTMMSFPMILFSDYNRQMNRRHDIEDEFVFEITLNIRHQVLEQEPKLPLVKRDFGTGNISLCNFCTTRNVYKLFGRTDSLANLSKDVELKCAENPTGSRKKHFLNILGILPPATLFRVSIHFGDVYPSDLSHLTSLSKSAQIYASFEIKHHSHQPTIFHHHHQRHSLTCRTRNLRKSSTELVFNQNFTFFERFHPKDSPATCLTIIDSSGHKLFKFKAPLAEFLHCRSVKQYFNLRNKKHNRYCRLQFSISVKPLTNSLS